MAANHGRPKKSIGKMHKKNAPLNGGKVCGADAVSFGKVKGHGEKAVILAESGGVSADVFGSEVTLHTFGGQLSAIVNAVNYASYNIQLFILP